MGEANRREELIIYNFEEGREAEVVKGEKFLSGLYVTVRSGRIFCHGSRSAPGPTDDFAAGFCSGKKRI